MTDRFDLLAWLCRELRRHRRGSTLAWPADGEPVLYVTGWNGRKIGIVAMEREGTWMFMWGRDGAVQASEDAARRIAAMTAS